MMPLCLRWAIKDSLLRYVSESDGQITSSAVRSESGFEFAGDPDGTDWFSGEVRMIAYGGLLDVLIADPRIEGRERETVLTARTASGARVALATTASRGSDAERVYSAALTREGAGLFGDFYPTGTELADIFLTDTTPRRDSVAIVGSGPAGCYTAQALRRALPEAEIVVLERLPVPYGLIRFGIAADHQGTKTVTKQFDRLFERDGISFVGNVTVGRDITMEQLQQCFDVVVLATGLPGDRPLGIPGETLPGVYGSGAFTRHLNGHPEHAFDDHTLGTDVVVVGAGNVALDIVRLLAKHVDHLDGSDIHPHTEKHTLSGDVQRITLLCRSPYADVRCDAAMVKELGRIPGVAYRLAGATGEAASPAARAIFELARADVGDPRLVVDLCFETTPVRILGSERVRRLEVRDGDGSVRVIPASAVVTAIGYHGDQVTNVSTPAKVGPGLFRVGWAHFGPRGGLPDARADAKRAAVEITGHLSGLIPTPARGGQDALATLLPLTAVDWAHWRNVDAAEIAAARPGRLRQKFLTTDELLRSHARTTERLAS